MSDDVKPGAAVYAGGRARDCLCGCGARYASRVCIVLRRFSERPCPRCLSDHPLHVGEHVAASKHAASRSVPTHDDLNGLAPLASNEHAVAPIVDDDLPVVLNADAR